MTTTERAEEQPEPTPVTDYRIWAHHASAAGAAQGILDKIPEEHAVSRLSMQHQVEKHQAKLVQMLRPERWPQQMAFQFHTATELDTTDNIQLMSLVTDAVQDAIVEGSQTKLLLTEVKTFRKDHDRYCDQAITLEEHTPSRC